jgi:hypothetical protein
MKPERTTSKGNLWAGFTGLVESADALWYYALGTVRWITALGSQFDRNATV